MRQRGNRKKMKKKRKFDIFSGQVSVNKMRIKKNQLAIEVQGISFNNHMSKASGNHFYYFLCNLGRKTKEKGSERFPIIYFS